MVSRRRFLGTLATIVAGSILPGNAAAQESRYDISFLWHPSIEAIEEYRSSVATALGPNVEKDLRIVKGRANFGLIYDRNGDQESSIRIAQHFTNELAKMGLDEAVAIRDAGYEDIFNVSYGLGRNLDDLKRRYDIVYSQLGEGVGKNLVIQETEAGNFVLTYQRFGTRESTLQTARRHNEILSRQGISASITPARIRPEIWGETSHLDVIAEAAPAPRPAARPESRRPAVEAPKAGAVTGAQLEQQVDAYIKDLKRRGVITNDTRTAWSVYDFTTGEKLVSINENVPMQAASMMKTFAALAFFHEVERGRLQYGPVSKRNMEQMIARSSNDATNWVMRQVGGPAAVNRILKQNYRHIFQEGNIVEYIPAGGRTYLNTASAHDYSRFLHAMWNGNIPQARELRRLMALPSGSRIYNGASRVPNGTLVYNKTGSTGRLIGDMGILWALDRNGNRHAYSIVGILERPVNRGSYAHWMNAAGNAIRGVSNVVYDGMKTRHNLK